jgi:hypothetical protein
MGRGVPSFEARKSSHLRMKACPVNTSLILFAEMAAFAAAISRHLAAGVVIWPVFAASVA